jgi:hypothetical protein
MKRRKEEDKNFETQSQYLERAIRIAGDTKAKRKTIAQNAPFRVTSVVMSEGCRRYRKYKIDRAKRLAL